jgi:hypothetical protein
MSNDSESIKDFDPKNDTISQISVEQSTDDKQNDKYNLSNVLKHIYALKYVQKNNENKSNKSKYCKSVIRS